jgi:hypothetical protein
MKPYHFAAVLALAAAAFLSIPPALRAVTCDGTELLCMDLTSSADVAASGGTVVGGDFNAEGFMPSDGGGIDWLFGLETNFASGRFEVDVKGLVPVEAGELEGGKVSIFALCGLPDGDLHGVDLQKMDPEYGEGHIFRYGMDDDGLADNWDAVIITSADFGCYYSINDPPWQLDQTHHFYAEWSAAGLVLQIDDRRCESLGNGDTFDVIDKVFTLAARCTHYSNQQAVARFSNFRLWCSDEPIVCGNGTCQPDMGEDCATCPVDCGECIEEPGEEPPDAATEEPPEVHLEDAALPERPADASADEMPAPDAAADPAGDTGPELPVDMEGGCGCAAAA